MSQDVSAFGFTLNLIASNTFPNGFPLSQFADDADPFDFPSTDIVDVAMGVNGDLITWSKASPMKTTVSVIAGSEDDINLSILLEANRVGAGKTSARDVMTLTAVYPSGNTLSLTNGVMTKGPSGASIASAGRIKTKTFEFAWENRTGVAV